MPRVFVNYRSGDGEATAALIDQELSRLFGKKAIFRASKSIAPGDNYRHGLLDAVRRSDLLLAVIGPRWLDAVDGHGRRRLDDPQDWARREIAEASAYRLRVIPVLVDSATPLREESLPRELAFLAECQYLRFSHRNVEAGLERLAREVVKAVPELEDRGPDDGAEGHGRVANGIGGVSGGNAVQGRDRSTRNPGGVGDVIGGAGTVIGTAHGPLHTGTGTQVNGPQFNGDQVNGPQFNGGSVNYVARDNHGGLHHRAADREVNER